MLEWERCWGRWVDGFEECGNRERGRMDVGVSSEIRRSSPRLGDSLPCVPRTDISVLLFWLRFDFEDL